MELVKKVILIAGAWKESNGQDVEIETEFEKALQELQQAESLNREEAVQLILKAVS